MDYAKAFKKIREDAGLSRLELAKELGVTVPALWKIETNHSIPKQKTIEKACRVCCVPLVRFFFLSFTDNDFWMDEPL